MKSLKTHIGEEVVAYYEVGKDIMNNPKLERVHGKLLSADKDKIVIMNLKENNLKLEVPMGKLYKVREYKKGKTAFVTKQYWINVKELKGYKERWEEIERNLSGIELVFFGAWILALIIWITNFKSEVLIYSFNPYLLTFQFVALMGSYYFVIFTYDVVGKALIGNAVELEIRKLMESESNIEKLMKD